MTTTVPASMTSADLATQAELDAAVRGPAFSAYRNTPDQGPVTANTWTKVQLNTEAFDTANAFDSTTNFRFTPQVAGYYQINGGVLCNGASTVTTGGAQIWKNGVAIASCVMQSPAANVTPTVSVITFLNGSTDYVELYGYVNGTGTLSFTAGSAVTQMTAALVRAS